jgi:hypothetical protein
LTTGFGVGDGVGDGDGVGEGVAVRVAVFGTFVHGVFVGATVEVGVR